MTRFDLFIGIDWSGAKGQYHRGIQVAVASAGHDCPSLITPPHPNGWSRNDVSAYLTDLKAKGRRILAGIDFAFAHPFGHDGYFPDFHDGPKDPEALWRLIDEVNHDQDHLYGGGLWGHPQLRRYYNAPKNKDGRGGKGDLFASRRRLTEEVAARMNNRSPSPTFNCVGPAGVGTGSLAGMRMLHHLNLQRDAVIWPFHHLAPQPHDDSLTLVEIFPALYFTMAGVKDAAKKSVPLDALNQGLAHFHASPSTDIAAHVPDHDDMDAIIAAAALRHLHSPQEIFPIHDEDHAHAMREGWIFGAGRVTT